MAKVFISYRRDDAKWQAREIYRSLVQVLPRDDVFMDVDSIPLGADFVDVLEDWVEQCDILLALIGAEWVEATDPKTGHRRLDNPNDFVRVEVRKALARGVPVVPVLLDGALIPATDRLPDDLKRLTRRNAEFVEHRTVDTDVERLIRKLGLAQSRPNPQQVRPRAAAPDRQGRIKVDAKTIHGAPDGWFLPGSGKTEWFRDHDAGPEMVVVPAGGFMMGSPAGEERWLGYDGREEPMHNVTIARPFAVGRHAITRGQFAAFVNNTGYKTDGGAYVRTGNEWKMDPKASWRAPGFPQDDNHPVVCVNWDDARAYGDWLSQQTCKTYRLLTETEWEYAARAGTMTSFWWGSSISTSQANYNGNYIYAGGSKGEYRDATLPAGSFEASPWGLFNVHGNAAEWCEDVWHENYNGAPTDGSAWLQSDEASSRVVRGGSWGNHPMNLRSAFRAECTTHVRGSAQSFRLARTLNP